MKKIIIILIVLIIIAAGYCIFIKKDETSNWQTYTNEEYGFEFKYPEDITLEIKGKTNYDEHQVILKEDAREFHSLSQEEQQKYFYASIGLSTPESIRDYDNNCQGECNAYSPIQCEMGKSRKCVEYNIGALESFGKYGVKKNEENNKWITLSLYLPYVDGVTELGGLDGSSFTDDSLKELAARGDIDDINLEHIKLFDKIFASIKFID